LSNRKTRRRLAGGTTLVVAVCTALIFLTSGAFAGGNAGYTTFDATALGCLDSPNGVDCNNYTSKDKVYMNGGPSTGAGLDPGDYFFAVLVPGFQNGGFLDGADGNLSDTTASADDKSNSSYAGAGGGDPVACRTFHTSGGLITSYAPTSACTGSYAAHATGTSTPQTGSKLIIQLAPYDDTTNAGGVYILAICKVGATSPSDCKFDAFRISGGEVTPAGDLSASKTAAPSFTRTFTWGITKSACAHGISPCTQTVNGTSAGAPVQFDYAVTVTKSSPGVDSGWQTSGTISVSVPGSNTGDVMNVVITDTDSNNGSCNIDGQSPASNSENLGTLAAGASVTKSYVCTFASNPGSGTNTVTLTWNPNLSDGTVTPNDSATGTADYTFGNPTTLSGNCITVTDTFNGTTTTLGSPCVTTTYNYSHTVNIPANGCVDYPNTATFTGAGITSGLLGTATKSVRVCRVPPQTGALTMGFWQNKNGQGIISGQAKTGTCPSATWLRQYAPFQDLSSTATCSGVATYVTNVIKAATCGGTACNAMLKAQMLATALDVYFSDPALGGNKINAPSPIGSRIIDLQNVCQMIDGSGGSATCSGSYYDVSSAFGGAACLSVSDMLTYAASQSNVGGTSWYGQIKATQVKAKDGFDAINNVVALIC
jgi:hypothetical protein